MRSTLACDMLRTLAFNMNHSTEAASLYEMAAVFDHHHPTQEGLPTETQTLCLGAYGADVDFFTVRGAVEAILHASGITCTVEPARTYTIIRAAAPASRAAAWCLRKSARYTPPCASALICPSAP